MSASCLLAFKPNSYYILCLQLVLLEERSLRYVEWIPPLAELTLNFFAVLDLLDEDVMYSYP